MQYIVVQKLYNDGQPPRVLCAIFLWDLPVPPDHSLSAYYYGQRVRSDTPRQAHALWKSRIARITIDCCKTLQQSEEQRRLYSRLASLLF